MLMIKYSVALTSNEQGNLEYFIALFYNLWVPWIVLIVIGNAVDRSPQSVHSPSITAIFLTKNIDIQHEPWKVITIEILFINVEINKSSDFATIRKSIVFNAA